MKNNRKSNRIIWGLVVLVVLMTLAVSFGTMSSHSQRDDSKKQDQKGNEDWSKYAVAEYDAPEPENETEREKRKLKNSRYDGQYLVVKNPHPDDGASKLFDELIPPPVIPSDESDLIIIGDIVNVSAYMSNDKRGVYSEFTIRINEILKNNASNKVSQGDSITADRMGGFVRYPNGQKVLYTVADKDLPRVGGVYLLFLTTDKRSSNYEILTGYELKDDSIIRLDTGRRFDDFKGMSKQNFIEAVRNKISESSTNKESRRKP